MAPQSFLVWRLSSALIAGIVSLLIVLDFGFAQDADFMGELDGALEDDAMLVEEPIDAGVGTLQETAARLSGRSGSPDQLGTLTVVGLVPAYYFTPKSDDQKVNGGNPDNVNRTYAYAKIVITKGVITELAELADKKAASKIKGKATELLHLRDVNGNYDVVYPGLIDLHNHTKQNMMPLWDLAKGQFHNRFEWRAWSKYKDSVSGNMNPWIGWGPAITCAAFRWSELQAMVLGTTYLQGPSSCVSNFSIHRVEDKSSYIGSKKAGVQAPTDIIVPTDFTFVWNVVVPEMVKIARDKNPNAEIKDHNDALTADNPVNYEEAVLSVFNRYCPKYPKKITDVNSSAALKEFKGLNALHKAGKLEEYCPGYTKKDKDPKFVRYMYWQHKTIAGKKNALEKKNSSALLFHLGEGRRKDPYNMVEFELVKVLGLDMPKVSFVHGVGIDKDGFKHMAKKNMGLVWSPFSNLLLYGETLEVEEAVNAGVTVALGSDWTPTGSRAVLEELKLAWQYIQKHDKVKTAISEYQLYQMVTENPAKLISHYELNPKDNEAGIGTIAEKAAGTLIVVKKSNANPFLNLIEAEAKDINLVLVDGRTLYGENRYLKSMKAPGVEPLPRRYLIGAEVREESSSFFETEEEMKEAIQVQAESLKEGLIANKTFYQEELVKALEETDSKKDAEALASERAEERAEEDAEKYARLTFLSVVVSNTSQKVSERCQMDKGMVVRKSDEETVSHFEKITDAVNAKINLDSPRDIQLLLAAGLTSQSRNWFDAEKKKEYLVHEMPGLYSCNDEPRVDPETGADTSYWGRLINFVSYEIEENWNNLKKNRKGLKSNFDKKMKSLYPDHQH